EVYILAILAFGGIVVVDAIDLEGCRPRPGTVERDVAAARLRGIVDAAKSTGSLESGQKFHEREEIARRGGAILNSLGVDVIGDFTACGIEQGSFAGNRNLGIHRRRR